ncbi:MAG: hypothetical protein E1N59_1348 [Puniceicoccaceae bacterium 5H]|nr:MAG: hypothetical protein E1N59_1348 [Puniceicoccaceae bacterium 5H]
MATTAEPRSDRNFVSLEPVAPFPQQQQSRWWYIDLLRIFGVLGVVLVHVCSRYQHYLDDTAGMEFWSVNFLNSICRGATALFIMVSGAMLLRHRPNQSVEGFYRRRFRRIGIPVAFWTVVYLGLRWIAGHHGSHEPVNYYAEQVAAGTPFWHLHFVYIIAGLYFFTPYLRRAIDALGNQTSLVLGISCLALASANLLLDYYLYGGLEETALSRFVPYIGFYILGYVLLGPSHLERYKWPALAIFITGFVVTALGNGWRQPILDKESIYYQYLFPSIALKIVALFILIRVFCGSLRYPTGAPGKLSQQLAAASLGVYLIHPLFLEAFERAGLNPAEVPPALGIPALTFMTFTLSVVATLGCKRLPYLRGVVGG